MILSGVSLVARLQMVAEKMFADSHPTFSEVIFISSSGVTLTPIVRHFCHKFHLAANAQRKSPQDVTERGPFVCMLYEPSLVRLTKERIGHCRTSSQR